MAGYRRRQFNTHNKLLQHCIEKMYKADLKRVSSSCVCCMKMIHCAIQMILFTTAWQLFQVNFSTDIMYIIHGFDVRSVLHLLLDCRHEPCTCNFKEHSRYHGWTLLTWSTTAWPDLWRRAYCQWLISRKAQISTSINFLHTVRYLGYFKQAKCYIVGAARTLKSVRPLAAKPVA